MGAFGTKPGMTVTGLDAGPIPMLFVALTVIVIDALFVSPAIVQVVDDVAHDCPELAVAVYEVIAEPFDAGALHATSALVFPPVAATFDGAPGTEAGVKLFDALEAEPVPVPFVAVTVNV